MKAFNVIEIIDHIKSRRIGEKFTQDILNEVKEFVINSYPSPSDDIDYQAVMAFIESKCSGKLGGSAIYTNKALTFLKNEMKDFRRKEKKENKQLTGKPFIIDGMTDYIPLPNSLMKTEKKSIVNWERHHEIIELYNKKILKESPEDVISKKNHYNIVIAKFLGAQDRIVDNPKYDKNPFVIYDFPNGHCLEAEYMSYHRDWQELMKAVDKIETLTDEIYHGDFSVIIAKNKCIITGSNISKNAYAYNEYVTHNNKITSTWLSVVWFIIWYNLNIKEKNK